MNEKPSHALEFFKKVNVGGITFLKGLIGSDPPSFETDWLDFKGAEQLKDKDVKKIWSEALAGFANTEGGVLVWGIDARPDPITKIDCASGLSLVKKPATFVSRLKELIVRTYDSLGSSYKVAERLQISQSKASRLIRRYATAKKASTR